LLPKKVILYFPTANDYITIESLSLNKTCFLLFMAKPAHQGTAFTPPDNIIFMTPDTLFVKCRQQRNRDFLCQSFFVACGALAPFALVSVVEDIEIMVAHPASKNNFMQRVVKPHGMFMVFAELLAFNVHDAFLDFFFLGPCDRCCQNDSENQNENKRPMLHKSFLR